MRWIPFLILTVVILIFQVGIVPPLGLGPQRIVPDLMLMLTVVLALRGEKNRVLLACWIIGTFKDLASEAPLGCHALTYGLAAIFIVSIRDYLYGNRPVILMLLTLVLAFLTQLFELWLYLVRQGALMESFRPALLNVLFSALFTAALAPYMSWLIASMHHQLGLPGRRN